MNIRIIATKIGCDTYENDKYLMFRAVLQNIIKFIGIKRNNVSNEIGKNVLLATLNVQFKPN